MVTKNIGKYKVSLAGKKLTVWEKQPLKGVRFSSRVRKGQYSRAKQLTLDTSSTATLLYKAMSSPSAVASFIFR